MPYLWKRTVTFKFKLAKKQSLFKLIASFKFVPQPAGPRAGSAEALALGARKTVADDIGGWERPQNLAFRGVKTFKLKAGPSRDCWYYGQSAGATAPPVCAP